MDVPPTVRVAMCGRAHSMEQGSANVPHQVVEVAVKA